MARRPGGEAAIRARLSASPGLTASEGHTLAGLLDAESHLAIVPNNGGTGWRCECSVTLRDDDQEVLIGQPSFGAYAVCCKPRDLAPVGPEVDP